VGDVSVRVNTRLLGDVDVEGQVRGMDDSFVLKGMFFSSVAKALPPGAWEALAPTLEVPPRGGRYLPFRDYPQGDYVRICAAVAQHKFPGVGGREALRRLARQDFDVFSTSTFGKVVLTLVRDARGALLKVPLVYEKVAPGTRVTASEVDDHVVRVAFDNYPSDWAYTVGQLEGVVLHYGFDPEILVRQVSPRHVEFDVRHIG
jgi:uncharacterized protein (TIGR02265 family)